MGAFKLTGHLTRFICPFYALRTLKAGGPNYFESQSAKRRLVYLRIPVYDTPASASDIIDAADKIISFMAKGLLRGSVLVHCNRGVSRSTTAVCLYLMR